MNARVSLAARIIRRGHHAALSDEQIDTALASMIAGISPDEIERAHCLADESGGPDEWPTQ